MYLCLECYETYKKDSINVNLNRKTIPCPKTKCCGTLKEIDELFVPIIKIFNQKGYYTKYCCSGHASEISPNSYISFKKNIKFPILPKGYCYDKNTANCIRINFKPSEETDLLREIINNALNISTWAERLKIHEE